MRIINDFLICLIFIILVYKIYHNEKRIDKLEENDD